MNRCALLAGCSIWAGAISSCAPELHVVVGASTQAHASVYLCRLAEDGWCAHDKPRLAMSAASDCETTGNPWVAIIAPEESRAAGEMPVQLPLREAVPFRSPCFQKPKAEHAQLVVTVRASCLDSAPRATVRREMP